MNDFSNWILKNTSNLFGLIGIILTFYFGVFYVPGWVTDLQTEKQQNAKENFTQSVKELIYSDSICTLSEILVLYDAIEIELKDPFPLALNQVLICAQESFMHDKYLPLEKRRSLNREIESIKSEINPEKKQPYTHNQKSQAKLYIFLSISLTVILIILGIASFFLRYRSEKEKQQEIDNQIISEDSNELNEETGYDYEKGILKIIESHIEIEVLSDFHSSNHIFDIVFSYNRIHYFVEIKHFSRSKVGLKSIERYISLISRQSGVFWFVYNTGLTDLVKRRIDDYNKGSRNQKIILIKATSVNEFQNEFQKLLSITPPKPHTS